VYHVVLLIDDQHRKLERIAQIDALHPAAAAAQLFKERTERVVPAKADADRGLEIVFIAPCAARHFQHIDYCKTLLARSRQRETGRWIGDDERLEHLVQRRGRAGRRRKHGTELA